MNKGNRHHLTPDQKSRIAELYRKGVSTPMLSARFNVTSSHITNKILPSHGIEVRTKVQYKDQHVSIGS